MTPNQARWVNIVGTLVVYGVLAGALVIQYGLGEKPCPLCFLQRLGMLGVCFGPVLNLARGIQPRHYGVSLISALFGGSVSSRQIVLHIVPGTGAYGSAVMGMHLYTWALVVFSVAVFGVSLMLMTQGQFAEPEVGLQQQTDAQRASSQLVIWGFVALCAINVFASLQVCGLGTCPDNP